jgi:hypothetical protein
MKNAEYEQNTDELSGPLQRTGMALFRHAARKMVCAFKIAVFYLPGQKQDLANVSCCVTSPAECGQEDNLNGGCLEKYGGRMRQMISSL